MSRLERRPRVTCTTGLSSGTLLTFRGPGKGRTDFEFALLSLPYPAGNSACRRPVLLEEGAQSQEGLGLQLRDSRLVQVDHSGDLAQSKLFVIVEPQHQLLSLGQAGDSLGEPPA